MKLLMITRKVDRNEHLAGFIYNWIKKLSERVSELRVITWQKGDPAGLPKNVKVFELPTKQNKLIKALRLKKLVKENIKEVDGVFCHQMPIYTILAAPIAKRKNKKVVSWYMHKQVDWKMKRMEKLSDVILSASKESFRLPSEKLVVTGHGIDTDRFSPSLERQATNISRLLSVGRISPTKDYESMIKAVDILNKEGIKSVNLVLIGEPGLPSHITYFTSLKEMVEKMSLSSRVWFHGSVPNSQIPHHLKQADIFINLSGTGSLDKAVLEAMASGCLVLTSNESFVNILPSILMVEKDNPKSLAERIKSVMAMPKEAKVQLQEKLRREVINNHDLDNLVKKIVDQFR